MNIKIEQPIDREQWLAALHAKGTLDEGLALRMDEAERLLKAEAGPSGTFRIMLRNEVKTKGFSIEKHLEGCHSVAVMAVTLGTGVDRLIRKTQITDMALAVIIDTGASVMVEQAADELQKHIEGQLDERDFSTSRFSPGYGDYSITEQSRIVHYLDGRRKIGLNVTADSLMIPRKSITALIGIADHPVTGKLATCDKCVLRDKCTLRKEGKFCGN